MNFTQGIVAAVQSHLKRLGYYRLALDGHPGPGTRAAVIDFKRNNGLWPRDYVGPLTLAKLTSDDAVAKPDPVVVKGEAPWMAEAKRLVGTREFAGGANNPVIMDWATGLDQWYPGDDVPWCGLFVAHCMAVGAPDVPQDFNRLGARNWLEYGEPCDPAVGAIAVFWRTHKTRSWNGHVGFVVGGDSATLHILGGNQSDSVNVTRIARDRLLGCRAPAGWSGDRDLRSVTTATLSTNEA